MGQSASGEAERTRAKHVPELQPPQVRCDLGPQLLWTVQCIEREVRSGKACCEEGRVEDNCQPSARAPARSRVRR